MNAPCRIGGRHSAAARWLLLLAAGLSAACGPRSASRSERETAAEPGVDDWAIRDHANLEIVRARLNQLVPVTLEADLEGLSEGDRRALKPIVQAARVMDTLFLLQVDGRNPSLKSDLKRMLRREPQLYAPLYKYFQVNFGPFDRLEGNAPFINVGRPKPPGAGFYPPDLGRPEFDAYLQAHPGERPGLTSPVTLIRRVSGGLAAIPYAQAYRGDLERAAARLREAAALTGNPSLRKFLDSRARAFLDNDYRASDIDWLGLSGHDLDVVIGPYEVYEDRLLACKAAFEAYVTRVDRQESRRLERLSSRLPELARDLPPTALPRLVPSAVAPAPIVVADEIYAAGDARAGVQTIAYDLPNDALVRSAHGSRQVMLRNVMAAKFRAIQLPVARRLMTPADAGRVAFAAYFYHTLLHEMAHAMGPEAIVRAGRSTTAGAELKELYPLIEEAKADAVGLWTLRRLNRDGSLPRQPDEVILATFLSGILRSLRFGADDPQGGANFLQFNYLRERGGFVFDPDGLRLGVDPDRLGPALRQLVVELLEIEGGGDYLRAAQLMARYGRPDEKTAAGLKRLAGVPVDIRPEFVADDETGR